jgi:hypothetical protein
MNVKAGIFVVTVFAGSLACGTARQAERTEAASSATTSTSNATVEPKVVRDEAGPDNSHIMVKEMSNGQRVEVRTWEAGPVRKVTRRERPGRAKTMRVVYRDGRAVRVDDAGSIEHALDWTGAQIAGAATKFGKEVGDRADDAGDEVADKAEDAKDQTVKGANEVADKAEDVKDETVKGAKKAGSEVADKAEDAKDQTVKGAKKIGEKLKP